MKSLTTIFEGLLGKSFDDTNEILYGNDVNMIYVGNGLVPHTIFNPKYINKIKIKNKPEIQGLAKIRATKNLMPVAIDYMLQMLSEVLINDGYKWYALSQMDIDNLVDKWLVDGWQMDFVKMQDAKYILRFYKDRAIYDYTLYF